jgi:hypothetical protein
MSGRNPSTDYWLGKVIFDLQDPARAQEYLADRCRVLDRYPLKPETRAALLGDVFEQIHGRVNAYLLRYYFSCVGWPDAKFIARLRDYADTE